LGFWPVPAKQTAGSMLLRSIHDCLHIRPTTQRTFRDPIRLHPSKVFTPIFRYSSTLDN
jgi:hypothetical protein